MEARRVATASVLALAIAGISLDADTVYVVNPAAKLLSGPQMNAPGSALSKGSALSVQADSGMFYKVTGNAGSGFVPRLFVSKFPPGQQVSFGAGIEKKELSKVRARASNYAQTAAARGLVASNQMRTRGKLEDFDFAAIEWLESVSLPGPQETL